MASAKGIDGSMGPLGVRDQMKMMPEGRKSLHRVKVKALLVLVLAWPQILNSMGDLRMIRSSFWVWWKKLAASWLWVMCPIWFSLDCGLGMVMILKGIGCADGIRGVEATKRRMSRLAFDISLGF